MSIETTEKKEVVRKCMGCETEDKTVHMFKGTFCNNEINEWVEEVYCNGCLANILTEGPEMVSHLEAI